MKAILYVLWIVIFVYSVVDVGRNYRDLKGKSIAENFTRFKFLGAEIAMIIMTVGVTVILILRWLF